MGLTQVKTTGLADDAVTLAKQAAGTDGQIITYDASGNPTAVGPGTDGQVLTSTGAGSPPAFEALPASGVTVNNATENEIVTVASNTSQLDAEATLTYDGTNLQQKQTGNTATQIILDSNRSAADNEIGGIVGKWDTETVADMRFFTDDDTSNKDNGYISFRTSTASGSLDETLRLKPNRDVQVTDGNLIIGTAGHGIDFSAVGAGSSVTAAENLLDDYECGTWTPAFTTGTVTSEGYYVKVGNLVHVTFKVHSWSDDTSGSPIQMVVRPFAAPRVKTIFSTQLTHFGSSPAVMHLETNNLWYLQYQTPSGGTSNFNHSDISDKTSSNLWVSGTYTIA